MVSAATDEVVVGRRYSNLNPLHRPHGMRAVIKWGVWDLLLGRRRFGPPGPPAPRVAPDLALVHDTAGAPRLTWIGHASFLGSVGGGTLLIDPVFSDRVGWVCRRYTPPGLQPADLPALDALLVTHCHYDHMDAPSARALPKDVPVFVPLGLGRYFRRWGYRHVTEMNWWDSAKAGPLRITFVPSRHWSRRWITDTNRTLWGGFVIEADGVAFYHSGDSAWFDGFSEIGRCFPGLLAAMLPIGCYSPPWFMEHNHMNPEQAGRAFLDLRARHLVPMHWGTFHLGDDPLSEPAERIRSWWQSRSLDRSRKMHLLAVGQTIVFDE